MSTVLYRTESPYVPQPVPAARAPSRLTELADDNRPLRVLVPSYRSDPLTGGQGVYLFYFTRALADLGHTVDVVSGPPYPELDARVNLIKLASLDLYAREKFWGGFPVLPARDMRGALDLYEYLAHISGDFPEPFTFGERLARYLRGRVADYDIVHDNQTLSRGLLQLERWGLPVVGTIHHPITIDRRIAIDAAPTLGLKLLTARWYGFLRMQRHVARRLRLITVASESTQRDAVREFGLDPARLALVRLGVDAHLFRPQAGIPRDPDLLLATASADVPLKGLTYLIEAYAQLLAERPRLKLQIIGRLRDGPTKQRLATLGLLERVSFVYGLTHKDLVRAYGRAAIFVSPSVYEGFGFPAAEAMACGAPVIATKAGSLPEIVGDAGVLVPARDSAALARAIAGLLDDPQRRLQLSLHGRERVVCNFTWEKAARAAVDVYRRMSVNADV
jgi:glycosyltransferase involved in cell wall biosynthesis